MAGKSEKAPQSNNKRTFLSNFSPAGMAALQYGKFRHVPMVGKDGPIQGLYQKVEQRVVNLSVPMGFYENPTLGMTALIDTLLHVTDPVMYRAMRDGILRDTINALVDQDGVVQAERFNEAKSKLGPALLGSLNGAVIREGLPIKGKVKPVALFEHNGVPKEVKGATYFKDVLVGLIAGLSGGAVAAGWVNTLPPAIKEAINPEYWEAIRSGAKTGGLVGLIPALASIFGIENKKGKAIGAATSLAAGVGIGGAIAESVTEAPPTITYEVSPTQLTEMGWVAPAVGLLAFGLIGATRILKHAGDFKDVSDLIHEIKSDQRRANGWQTTLSILVESLHFQRRVHEKLSIHRKKKPLQAKEAALFKQEFGGEERQVFNAVSKFKNRTPETIKALTDLTPTQLNKLTKFLMQIEMLSWYTNERSGGDTIVDIVPRPHELFGNIDIEMLGLVREGTTGLLKSLKGSDPVGAISILFPSVSMLALAANSTLGKGDDTVHFGQRGFNTATRGLFLHPAVKATQDATLTFSSDTLRGSLWTAKNIQEMAETYQMSIPIGGLDRINRPPVHGALLQLYGVAHSLSQETASGEGSKGLHSDVGETILKSMEINPLFGYIALADISAAIDFVPQLLKNLPKETRTSIEQSLRQLRGSLIRTILDTNLPVDKTQARRLLTDEATALNGYIALEMLVESCGDEAVAALVSNRIESMFPVSGVSGDPLIYAETLANWVSNLRRQAPHSQLLGKTVLDQILPQVQRIAEEYLEKIGPTGTHPIEAQHVGTISDYIKIAMNAGAFNDDEKARFIDKLGKYLIQWSRQIAVKFPGIPSQKELGRNEQSDLARLQIITSIALELNAEGLGPVVKSINSQLQRLTTAPRAAVIT